MKMMVPKITVRGAESPFFNFVPTNLVARQSSGPHSDRSMPRQYRRPRPAIATDRSGSSTIMLRPDRARYHMNPSPSCTTIGTPAAETTALAGRIYCACEGPTDREIPARRSNRTIEQARRHLYFALAAKSQLPNDGRADISLGRSMRTTCRKPAAALPRPSYDRAIVHAAMNCVHPGAIEAGTKQ